ncbi:MAG: iron uptake transporter permease EfeU [Chloroflexota bacterium]
MDFGSFASGLLTGLREGVEAALIVAIVLAYLVRTGNGAEAGKVWIGAIAAVILSAGLGFAIYSSVGAFEEPYEQIFEGTTMLLAAGVVTWMLFWMRRAAGGIKGELQSSVDRVLVAGGAWGLAILAFTAVIREGVETALFLVGQATSAESGASAVLGGAVVGIAVAAAIGYGFYRGSRRVNLAVFFKWTGIALIFIAAGLLSHGLHEFIEIGLFGSGPLTQPAFDVSGVLSHDDGIGSILRALFGYSANPEWLTLIVHVAYIVIVLALYLRPLPPRPAPTQAAPQASGS